MSNGIVVFPILFGLLTQGLLRLLAAQYLLTTCDALLRSLSDTSGVQITDADLKSGDELPSTDAAPTPCGCLESLLRVGSFDCLVLVLGLWGLCLEQKTFQWPRSPALLGVAVVRLS